MAAACYSGPIPVTDEERLAIWQWAKANAIDHGMPIDKVGDAINERFFAGQAKPEWLTDILSGRKTPFRSVADDAWRKQYYRRQIVQQAKNMSREQAYGPVGKLFRGLWSIPREISVLGHGFVFPVSHAGDLLFRPQSWATYIRGILNTYRASFSPAYAARILDNMERQPLFTTALRSGLDVGKKSVQSDFISHLFRGSHEMSKRAWDMLTALRYELWQGQMQKFIKPGMTNEEVIEIGKNLADWANHATGSARMSLGKWSPLLFGPKLTVSKVSRIFADPAQTIKTFSNWGQATPGEKAVAWTRLSGAAQYAGTMLGFLAVNQGLLNALGVKQQINWTDPTKSDFLQFKMGGLEGYAPGLHSEIRTLGQILATSWMNSNDPNLTKWQKLAAQDKTGSVAKILGQYALNKAAPPIQMGKEILTGQDFRGRPMPWSNVPGKVIKKTGKVKPGTERLDWTQYALSHAPIPLSGPTGYVYDKLRQGGASALDASTMIKGLMMFGLGATGLHVHEAPPVPASQPVSAHRQQVAAALRASALR